MDVRIKRVHPNAEIPEYAKEGDAGLDLKAVSIIHQDSRLVTYDTGISFEIPRGYVGLVYPRSSIRNTTLILSNSVGVIDSGYRGTVKATFLKQLVHSNTIYEVGERICQLIIMPYPKINLIPVLELSKTERGDNGFGSTGK